MKIKINAIDTLFFRDGKPFGMGDSTWANGIFPPNLSVIYGAIRSKFLSENGFSDYNIKESEKLRIINFGLFQDNNILFPVPGDVVVEKKAGGITMKNWILELELNNNSSGLLDYNLSFKNETKVESTLGKYLINENDFPSYVSGIDFDLIPLNSLVISEPKVGIGRNNQTRTTEEGQLYRVDMNRPVENLSFVVEFEGIEIQDKGLLKFGAESKVVSYESSDFDFSVEKDINTSTYQYLKLYLITPAILEKGWIPKWINDEFIGILESGKVKLIAASLGKSMHIGGFDIKKKSPKPMLKAVPSGSIYYLKILEGENEKVMNELKSISMVDIQAYSYEGYGKHLIIPSK